MNRLEAIKTKRKAVCEVVSLSVVIGLAWVLLLMPIIVYYLPDEVFTRKVSFCIATAISPIICG